MSSYGFHAPPLRYQKTGTADAAQDGEIALLHIRNKLPGAQESRLVERPISQADAVTELTRASEPVRWAVAGFGQLLRGDPHLARGYAGTT